MPAWVSSAARPAPRDRTVFVRFGAVMFSAGWFQWPWPGAWFGIEPRGRRTQIADPPLWWDASAPDVSLEEELALVFGQEVTRARPQRGAKQLSFALEVSDSGMLSTRRAQ